MITDGQVFDEVTVRTDDAFLAKHHVFETNVLFAHFVDLLLEGTAGFVDCAFAEALGVHDEPFVLQPRDHLELAPHVLVEVSADDGHAQRIAFVVHLGMRQLLQQQVQFTEAFRFVRGVQVAHREQYFAPVAVHPLDFGLAAEFVDQLPVRTEARVLEHHGVERVARVELHQVRLHTLPAAPDFVHQAGVDVLRDFEQAQHGYVVFLDVVQQHLHFVLGRVDRVVLLEAFGEFGGLRARVVELLYVRGRVLYELVEQVVEQVVVCALDHLWPSAVGVPVGVAQ